jgi:hypothetical protein
MNGLRSRIVETCRVTSDVRSACPAPQCLYSVRSLRRVAQSEREKTTRFWVEGFILLRPSHDFNLG